MENNISFLTAFVAGILSFLSPCVLPLIPGYISFFSGVSITELSENENIKKIKLKIMLNAIAFTSGFTVVFILLGATATKIGQLLVQYQKPLSIIAGIIIIIMGLHLIGIFKIKALYYEKKLQINLSSTNIISSFLIGFAFAFGWTPCIGPILAGILALAANQQTLGKGILLLFTYSMGLAIPFLLTAYSITLFFKVFNKIKRYLYIIEWMAGVLLIIIGILIATGQLIKFSSFFTFLNKFAL